MHTQDEIKHLLGKKAADLIEDGMLVGLGTGSTAICFIENLIKRCQEGLKITAVSSSLRSEALAKQGGIEVLSMKDVVSIDFTVDGADEVDIRTKCMIKGGGGAHLREKIVAKASKKWLGVIDASKLVTELGACRLPVEIIPFGEMSIIAHLQELGYQGNLRMKDSSLYITDNGNYIFDIHTPTRFPDPRKEHAKIKALPGVVETGFFFDLPSEFLVGYHDGRIELIK